MSKLIEGNCEYAASACNPVSRRTGDSAVCRHHDTCLRRMEIPTFPAALSRTQKKTDTSSVATGEKSWLMTIPESISIRYSPSTHRCRNRIRKNVISGDTTEITVKGNREQSDHDSGDEVFLSMAAQSRERES